MDRDEDQVPEAGAETVSMSVDISDGQTLITVTGDCDAAVVVRSANGERIYLPPEDFDRSPSDGQSPYEGPGETTTADSPYDGAPDADGPYRGMPDADATGLEPTPEGFRIRHEEPVTDLRLLR